MLINKQKLSILIIIFYFLFIITPIIKANIEYNNILPELKTNLEGFKDTTKNLNILVNKSLFNIVEYRAILIGIKDYPGDNGDLPYSINEINSFKKTLIDGGNWVDTNIQVITDQQANKNNIFNSIDLLSNNTDDNDVTIFYYAGHGGKDSNNEYLLVYDDSISDIELNEKLDTINGRVIIILDSCYSGGFIEELKGFKRVIMTACGKKNLTYQHSEIKSGIFGYFVNLSLQKITKNAEFTYLFAYIGTVYYTKKLSEKWGKDYNVSPKFYDGTIGITKIINHHNFTSNIGYELIIKTFSRIFNNKENSIWNM